MFPRYCLNRLEIGANLARNVFSQKYFFYLFLNFIECGFIKTASFIITVYDEINIGQSPVGEMLYIKS